MPALFTFDEVTTTETAFMTIDQYFGEMSLDKKQKRERIRLAKKLKEELLALIYLICTLVDSGSDDTELVVEKAKKQYRKVIDEEMIEYIEDIDRYVSEVVPLLCLTLWRTATETDEDKRDDRFDRMSEHDACEDANTILNVYDHHLATKSGKTKKTWHTKKDEKVRTTHRELERVTIPIDDFFIVGLSKMLYPRDFVNCKDINEIANCRCTVTYS